MPVLRLTRRFWKMFASFLMFDGKISNGFRREFNLNQN